MKNTENSYEKRVVKYENIHSIDENDFIKMVELMEIKEGYKILDVCSGYGSVTKRIFDTEISNISVNLLDSAELQINRAKENLSGVKNVSFTLADATRMPYKDNSFDLVVNKMGLHEVSKDCQILMLNEMYRVLKPSGKIVIWELALNKDSQPIFQDFIRKKDELCGFQTLVNNRYFQRKDEIIVDLASVGFINPHVAHNVFPDLWVRKRKSEFVSAKKVELLKDKLELSQLDLDLLEKESEGKIKELCEYAKINLNDIQKNIVGYEELGNDIVMRKIEKAIFVADKKSSL